MAEDERQFRVAAEALLTGSINSQRSSYTQRTPDAILNDLIAGSMPNDRMSNVRRFFCLFVTFDLLLIFLMWLICTMIAGESLESAFLNQVVHYHIKTSLFDIVMAAICRFTLLLLFYALLKLNHWIIVALTTATTCAFLIAKVFLFDWTISNQPVFQVLLILTSFILPWVEAWFFDIRVVPQEIQARNWIRNVAENEREPLLQNLTTESRQYSAEPAGTYFTPIDSPEYSDYEDEYRERRSSDSRVVTKGNEPFPPKPLPIPTSQMIEEYKRKAHVLVQNCFELLQSADWQIHSIQPNGDIIFYMDRPKQGRILKIMGILDVSPNVLMNKLFDEFESSPSWNRLVTESKKLQCIDENTDIVYQVTNSLGGGIIGARDFVILRHRMKLGNYYINSGTSVALTALPNRNNVVRAENSITCCASELLPNENNRCRFTWIVNTNLKGWLPKKIVDKSMNSALIDFMTYVRKYIDESQRSIP